MNPSTVIPPWCLTLHVSGHTFNKDFGTSIPEYVHIHVVSELVRYVHCAQSFFCFRSSFDSEDVIFPATIIGQAVYHTVAIRNTGNEPTLYSIQEDNEK